MGASELERAPVLEAGSAVEEIRRRTSASHARLERSLAIAADDVTPAIYSRHLRALWGWVTPLEARLRSLALPLDFQASVRLVKARWLAEDLEGCGLSSDAIAALPRLDALFDDASLPQALGAAYVLEGAQLGGAFLARRWGEALAPWPLRYFKGYGDETGLHWKAFLRCLERHAPGSVERAEAARAASQQFVALEAWMKAQGAAR